MLCPSSNRRFGPQADLNAHHPDPLADDDSVERMLVALPNSRQPVSIGECHGKRGCRDNVHEMTGQSRAGIARRSCHSWWVGDPGNRSAACKVWIAEGQLPVPRGLELCAIEELGADKIGAGEVGGIED
jgi:hypothetical protein